MVQSILTFFSTFNSLFNELNLEDLSSRRSQLPALHPAAMEPVGQARAGQLDDARGAAREVLAVEDVDVRLLSRGRRRRAEDQDPDAVAEAAVALGHDRRLRHEPKVFRERPGVGESVVTVAAEVELYDAVDQNTFARRAVDVGAADRPRRDRKAARRVRADAARVDGRELARGLGNIFFAQASVALYSPFIQERGRV